MKILILGGTSYFGRETAVRLSKAGNDVTVFSRRCPADGLPLDVKQARGDRAVGIDLSRMAVEPWDAVIDNICFSAGDARKAVEVFNGRTGLYIYTSSAGVYGLLDGAAAPFRENLTELLAPKEPPDPGSEYETGKFAAELEFLRAAADLKFPAAVIRPPVVIGPGDPTLRAYSYWLRLADGGPLFLPGFAFRSRFIWSSDMARALEALLYAGEPYGKVYNIGGSEALTLEDFVRLSARVMHRDAEILYPDNDWLTENGFDLAASPFSAAGDFVADISRAERELGWASTPAAKWLEETINWYMFSYTGPAPENYRARKAELALAAKWKTRS